MDDLLDARHRCPSGYRQTLCSYAVDLNCHHPLYDHNPDLEAVPSEPTFLVGNFWGLFGAGHLLEMKNLKAIVEYCHHNDLPVNLK